MKFYKFKPIIKTLVWGTEKWVLSGVPGNESVVDEGPDKGKTLSEIWPAGQFPLLVKFIDARQDLSIQVHPDDELAARRHGCKGKTEMWYVIGASRGAHLLSGFKSAITPAEFVELVHKDEIVSVLSSHEVNPGDVFFLPAGRVHAIGGGCYLAEIQQTSDITYRIYDYNRPGLDGKPRQLHTREAVDAIDYSLQDDYRTRYEHRKNSRSTLVSCPYFTTSLYELDKDSAFDFRSSGSFVIIVCVEGSGKVGGVTLCEGESMLVLDPEEIEFVPDERMKILASQV